MTVDFIKEVEHSGKTAVVFVCAVDEFYYNYNLGGLLECKCRKYTDEGWADILWVTTYSPLVNGNSSKLLLRLMQPTLLG